MTGAPQSGSHEPAPVLILELEFDQRNRSHFSHGLTEDKVLEVLLAEPKFFVNPPLPNRSGTHLMIGPSLDGTFWTIVIVEVDDSASIWRPITGWPSTRTEEFTWHASV